MRGVRVRREKDCPCLWVWAVREALLYERLHDSEPFGERVRPRRREDGAQAQAETACACACAAMTDVTPSGRPASWRLIYPDAV